MTSKQEAFDARLKVELHLTEQGTSAFLISRINLFSCGVLIVNVSAFPISFLSTFLISSHLIHDFLSTFSGTNAIYFGYQYLVIIISKVNRDNLSTFLSSICTCHSSHNITKTIKTNSRFSHNWFRSNFSKLQKFSFN